MLLFETVLPVLAPPVDVLNRIVPVVGWLGAGRADVVFQSGFAGVGPASRRTEQDSSRGRSDRAGRRTQHGAVCNCVPRRAVDETNRARSRRWICRRVRNGEGVG